MFFSILISQDKNREINSWNLINSWNSINLSCCNGLIIGKCYSVYPLEFKIKRHFLVSISINLNLVLIEVYAQKGKHRNLSKCTFAQLDKKNLSAKKCHLQKRTSCFLKMSFHFFDSFLCSTQFVCVFIHRYIWFVYPLGMDKVFYLILSLSHPIPEIYNFNLFPPCKLPCKKHRKISESIF